ncbi:hypothetical protein RASY3_10975 [Ruminococcus albus SY3]|uniref:Uncharacterized protein n=1 Tax=Ruminococcus albus SY3 TaxID=1341156 RepID=A0A011VU08_RUMAL|nr:hypothetical protein [Ruminococcus albus]EXM38751.1 hypothetical protein RASY3_19665 [Ruminococcus albus SY3]EXM39138.1 hypothetical protein RASY3_10975 [Ruminococcus albus SY3]
MERMTWSAEDYKYIDEKYYAGFEGEEEYVFFTCDEKGIRRGYGIWDGYLGAVVDGIKPEEYGFIGLQLYYHVDMLNEELCPDDVYEFKDPVTVYRQLAAVDKTKLRFLPKSGEVLDVLKKLFRDAAETGKPVCVYYF